MYVLKVELEAEQRLHQLTRGKLAQVEALLVASQREVGRLVGENRELREEVKNQKAIIENLTDTPY